MDANTACVIRYGAEGEAEAMTGEVPAGGSWQCSRFLRATRAITSIAVLQQRRILTKHG